MKIRKAVITAAGRQQRTLPLQTLTDRDGQDKSVLSGLFKGAGEIKDRPAIVDLPQGKGQIVLFAGNPCYRWQNHGEFGMLFNTVLHWNDLLASKAPAAPEKPAAAGEQQQ